MSTAESAPRRSLPARLLLLLRWLLRACWVVVRFLFRFLLVSWGTLAIYYSNLPWYPARVALAGVFLVFAVWALWVARRRPAYLGFTVVYLALLGWWILIPPLQDRPWRQPVAVLPKAIIDGDHVRLINFRHFEYRTRDDFTVHYEEREVDISHLTSVDLFVSYWKIGPVGHTFVSFNFDNALPVCISIETRPEEGESFQPIASMFKKFELFYAVGDERDLIRLRTDHRGEEVFMYPILTSPENAQALFRVYLQRINELAEKPEWYHLLSNSCTINIVRYANKIGRTGGFDIRLLLNGWADRYLYRAGLVNTSIPFDELRRRSRITEVSQQAGDAPDFSRRIRAALPVNEPAAK
ncbi:MAG: DUF4105 domain-containing protein [Planctomycetes bacterium]|nr:DUF4105 domain-containing protein [Planctomycetota bacterium]